MLIHWIVDGIKGDLESGFSSTLASNRYRAILPAQQLRRAGHTVVFVPMSNWTKGMAGSDAHSPDVYVIGKLLPNNDPQRFERLALQVLDGTADANTHGITTVADFSDDHFHNPQVGAYWRALAAQASICTTGSDVLAQAVQSHSNGPVVTVGDPLASPEAKARVFQATKGVSAWAQKLLGGSNSSHRLKLVWYGNNGNWPSMQRWADALGNYSANQPLLIWIVTRANTSIENYIQRFNQKYQPSALMELIPWEEITQWSVVNDADIVLVPSDLSATAKTAKSANRLTDALNAGRYVVASPIPAYEIFRPYASLTNDPVQAIQDYLAHPGLAMEKLSAGQVAVRTRHDVVQVAAEWMRAFALNGTGPQDGKSAFSVGDLRPPVATEPFASRSGATLTGYVKKNVPESCAVNSSDLITMPNFSELFMAHTGNISSKWVQYLEVYERYFAPYRYKPCKILEIGVQNGGSLQLYQKYFPFAKKIVGIDIDPKCKRVEAGNIHIEIGSQVDRNFLEDVNTAHGPFDIVVDDGSHVFEHQIASFETIFPQLSPASVYIVEDTHTSYLPDFGGGVRKPGTFIEYAKFVLDQINAPFFADAAHQTAWLAEHLYSLSFYDSMVVFEKRPKAAPFALAVGSDGHRQVPNFQDLAYFRKKHSLR